MADEFGGEIPVGPFALIGDDSIGRGIVETLRGHRSPAVLMQNHGVFTIGADAAGGGQGRGDVRGRRPHRAHRPPARRRRSRSRRPTSTRSTTATRTSTASADQRSRPRRSHRRTVRRPPTTARSGSSPAARPCTATETLARSPTQSQAIADRLDGVAGPAGRASCGSRCCSTPASIRRPMLEANAPTACVGVIAWMHTFSPAKMWIAGLDALRKPLLHLHTQANVALPWSTIDMDFMNLNQAAHGDREFGYIQTRLGVAAQDRRRPRRVDPRGRARDRRLGARRGRRATSCARLRLARFGDNMRDVAVTEGDKVEAELRFGVSVNTYGVNDLVAVVDAGRRRRRRHAGRPSTPTPTASRPSCCPAATGTSRCATAPASSWACARSSTTAASARSPRTSRTSAGCASCPGLAVQRLMADGYGFGGEGDWKTVGAAARAEGDGRRPARRHVVHGGLHLPPRARARRRSSARTCSRSARRSPPAQPSLEIHPLGIGGREDPVRLVFTADPGPAVVVGLVRPRRPVPARPSTRSTWSSPTSRCPSCPVARAVWKPRPDAVDLGRVVADGRRPAPHRAVHRGRRRGARRPRRDAAHRAASSSTPTPRRGGFQRELRWNQAYHRLAQRL